MVLPIVIGSAIAAWVLQGWGESVERSENTDSKSSGKKTPLRELAYTQEELLAQEHGDAPKGKTDKWGNPRPRPQDRDEAYWLEKGKSLDIARNLANGKLTGTCADSEYLTEKEMLDEDYGPDEAGAMKEYAAKLKAEGDSYRARLCEELVDERSERANKDQNYLTQMMYEQQPDYRQANWMNNRLINEHGGEGDRFSVWVDRAEDLAADGGKPQEIKECLEALTQGSKEIKDDLKDRKQDDANDSALLEHIEELKDELEDGEGKERG